MNSNLKIKQIDKLKSVICQLIDDNQFIINMLNFIKQRGNLLPIVELTYTRSCIYNPTLDIIKLSISDIIDFYRLSKLCNNNQNLSDTIKPIYLNNHFHCVSFWEISVNMPLAEEMLIVEKMEQTNFLKDDKATKTELDTLTQFSIAYSLYHEIGHAFHNKYILESEYIKREIAADAFAFEAIKSMRNHDNYDILLKGAFIGVIQMLMRRKQQEEVADEKHPHSIERIYNLFYIWGIQDDSYFWEQSFLFVCRWLKWNHEPMDWLVDSSLTPYDKFMEAYSRYKKAIK
jgi:hypothetical protein